MHRVKHPPIRNKIDLTDPGQVRAWTRRLRVSAGELRAVVGKVGNSVAAASKEIELQRINHQPCPVPPTSSSIPSPPVAESELPAPV